MGWENAYLHRFEINGVEYGTGPGSRHKDPALEDVVAPRLDIRRRPGAAALERRTECGDQAYSRSTPRGLHLRGEELDEPVDP